MEQTRSLSERTLKALGWQFGSVSCRVVLQLVVMVLLSRLLPVRAFGVVGQAMIVVYFATVFSDIGMAPAIIQRGTLTQAHIHSAFTISCLTGVLLCAGTWLVAPVVGVFFKTADVVPVLRALSFLFLLSGLGTTARAVLQRRLDFRSLFWTELGSYLLGYAIVGVGMALLGYGVWALVWASIVQAGVQTVMILRFWGQVPKLGFAVAKAKSLLSFGAGNSLIRVVLYAAKNVDYAVVGRSLGAEALGLYTRAYQLMTLPITRFSGVLNTVFFPVYAEIQDERERLWRAYLGNVSVVALVMFPLFACMAVVGPEVIRGLFGPRWAEATLPFRILCVGGIPACVYSLGEALARAKGVIAGRLWRHLAYLIGALALASYGVRWGIAGVALGVAVVLILEYVLMAQLSIRLVKGRWRDFFAAQCPGAALGIVAAAMAFSMAIPLRNLELPDLAVLCAVTMTDIAAITVIVLLVPVVWLPQPVRPILARLEARWKSPRRMLLRLVRPTPGS